MVPPLILFLRPLPPPHRSSLLLLLRPFSSTSPKPKGAQQFVNKRPPRPSSTTRPPTSSSSSAAAKRKSPPTPAAAKSTTPPESPPPVPDITQPLPYHIHRTPSQQLPVYQLAKRGGNLLLTRLRKIDGDIAKLKEELQQALGLKQEQISINQLTKHIIIKGWRRNEVNQFLQTRNF
ncbi:MAG: hypothetical protein LQ339_000539 [Xanthoria mediterranea]|nr:MAG: hypothetical protein LQ339_000539 [Xanthoria mediterranea]